MSDYQSRAAAFAELHEGPGTFVIPNPWDIGSARLLASQGYKALATTSSGLAYTLGRPDGTVNLDEIAAHGRELSDATGLPVSADLENCFSHDPQEAAHAIDVVAKAGIAGGSIEDYSGDRAQGIYDFNHAVERVAAAVEAARRSPTPFVLTARAENLIRNVPDLDDTIARLKAFEAVGADVLYAPGLRTVDDIERVANELSRPINVLAPLAPGVSVADYERIGIKRLSVGGALSRAALGAMLNAGREMLEAGTFKWTQDLPRTNDIESVFSDFESKR